MEYKGINNNETGSLVRGKINQAFQQLITGREGINEVWKNLTSLSTALSEVKEDISDTDTRVTDISDQLQDYTDREIAGLVNYVNAMNGGVSGFAKDTSYNPNFPVDRAATVITTGAGTFTNIRDINSNPITITNANSFTIFFKPAGVSYWDYKTLDISIDLLQTTGTSTTATMSQNAVSSELTRIEDSLSATISERTSGVVVCKGVLNYEQTPPSDGVFLQKDSAGRITGIKKVTLGFAVGITPQRGKSYLTLGLNYEFNGVEIVLTGASSGSGVFNVTTAVPLAAGSYYTLSTAIAAVPTASKSLGLDLKFATAANTWVVYRYKGSDLTGWATTTNWEQVPDAAKLSSLETNLNYTKLGILQKTSWPLSSYAECLSQPTLNFSVMRRFLVDMYMTGQVAGKQYSAAVIKRNDSGIWSISIYEETPVSTGTPSVFRRVSIFYTTSNPENGDAITIHTLSQSGGSGISGKVAVRWSAIPNGEYTNMWASGSHMYRLDEEIFNKNKSNYIYPIDRVSENNAQIITDINDLYDLDKINDLFTNTIDYDAFTSQLSWTTQNGGSAFGKPFTGWGALFNKVGISFNCIKIPAIKRNTPVSEKKWVSIQLVVKNSASSSTILALSPKIPLDPEANTVTDIIIPLMNSDLTDSVTLNDTSFSGSTYFIGYCFYAADGTYAFGGTVTGTQSNYAGASYYITNASFAPSVPTSWVGYSGNPCIPMEHALLTGIKLVKHLKELDVVDLRIDQIQEEVDLLSPEAIDISLPDKIYAIVGDRLQLFYRGMIKAPNPYIYDILVSCSKGVQYPRYFEYLPVSGDVGTTTFKVEVKNKDGVILGTKTCSLITKAVVQSPSTTKKVLCVGDSLTSSGVWCIEASRRLIGTGGTPAGLALSNISFLGRKTGGGIGWEGTGGWTWDSYATAGTSAYKFMLSGVTTAPGIGSTYTNNGVTFTVSEVNITGGTGYISATGSGTPTSSGTLTKASGAGDATLTFSSYIADSGNPFWEADTNSLDFPQYVNTYMGGGCDVIYFLLTWNGQTPWRTDFASMITTAKILIDHIHTHYPNCKMKIMGIQVPSLNGGMGANYGATGTSYSDMYGMVVTAMNMNKAYQDWCNEAAYLSFMEFVNISSQFDSENNMPETDKAVNTRATKTEKIGTNGVHPSAEGYYQIGDVVFRNFVANFCQ